MSKKKSTPKKHKFKYAEPTESVAASASQISQSSSGAVALDRTRPVIAAAEVSSAYSYVSSDLRRTGILSAVLIGLELVLYYVMIYTPVGESVYKLVKV